MIVPFSKYQGTGNDFILIDNRAVKLDLTTQSIEQICDRKFGIGSDGLILINNQKGHDFRMDFFNPDGSQSFCGNGSRCALKFFDSITEDQKSIYTFQAIDGVHNGKIQPNGLISVSMADTKRALRFEGTSGFFLNTGSPHYVNFCEKLDFEIIEEGRRLRNNKELFGNNGTNVNFVKILEKGSIFVRTYERGVESETLSCGTGVTASGLIYSETYNVGSPIKVKTKGGDLEVSFEKENDGFKHVVLSGPAEFVFAGEIEI